MPISSRELSYMNPSSEDGPKSNQETQAFDPPTDEEKVDDEKERVQDDDPAEVEEDKERAETVAKEAMLRVTGGQL